MCRFFDAGNHETVRMLSAGVQKAPRHEVAGGWAVVSSERYGDLRSAPASMVGARLVRGDLYV